MHYALHSTAESLIVDLEGDFSFHDADTFMRIMRAMRPSNDRSSPHFIHMNLDRLETIDSYALDLLLQSLFKAKQNHMTLTFEKPHGSVMQKLVGAARVNRSLVIVA